MEFQYKTETMNRLWKCVLSRGSYSDYTENDIYIQANDYDEAFYHFQKLLRGAVENTSKGDTIHLGNEGIWCAYYDKIRVKPKDSTEVFEVYFKDSDREGEWGAEEFELDIVPIQVVIPRAK